jgi:hypothetical protein
MNLQVTTSLHTDNCGKQKGMLPTSDCCGGIIVQCDAAGLKVLAVCTNTHGLAYRPYHEGFAVSAGQQMPTRVVLVLDLRADIDAATCYMGSM